MLEFIWQYMTQHRAAPLIREVQLGCQIASYKSAVDRLNALERKGFIRRTPSRHRGIRLARQLAAQVLKLEPPRVQQAEEEGVASR
jgi:SOS-response transcriptional repressor LexA